MLSYRRTRHFPWWTILPFDKYDWCRDEDPINSRYIKESQTRHDSSCYTTFEDGTKSLWPRQSETSKISLACFIRFKCCQHACHIIFHIVGKEGHIKTLGTYFQSDYSIRIKGIIVQDVAKWACLGNFLPSESQLSNLLRMRSTC